MEPCLAPLPNLIQPKGEKNDSGLLELFFMTSDLNTPTPTQKSYWRHTSRHFAHSIFTET
jgi:hypothetical protein